MAQKRIAYLKIQIQAQYLKYSKVINERPRLVLFHCNLITLELIRVRG